MASEKNENNQKEELNKEVKNQNDVVEEKKIEENSSKIKSKNEKEKVESDNKNKKDNENKSSEKKITNEEFTEKIIKKKKRQMKIVITITIMIILLLFFSIFFAVLNVNKTTYLKGISLKNVDISGLTIDEAKNKLEDIISRQLDNSINIIYNEEIISTIKAEDIEFSYDLTNQLKELYKIGRSENIFMNNFEIISTAIFKKNTELKYTYNEEKLNEIIRNLDANIPGLVTNPSYYIEEKELIIVAGIDGITVERDTLKHNIIEKIISNDNEESLKDEYDIKIPVVETKAESIDIEQIYEEIYCEPKDAYYVEEPFELHMDEDGIDFAITMEEAKNTISTPAEEYKIPLTITKAKKTINDIDSSAFRYEVSTFSTNYDPGYTSRVNNLQLATAKINGKVLGPGEEFSYNEVVGKRTIEAGYTNAKIFLNGEVVDGTGGGICQVSTTLYNAVLLANLEVTDRRNHNYTTSYVKPGKDATVVYGAIDFKFKNNRDYPIKIEGKVSGGVIRFTIYGIQQENEYDIKIIPVVTQTIPKTTQYIDDPTLVEGSEVVKQVGSSGCKVTTYKETYLNGSLISKEVISNDVYKAMARIVRRGTQKASVPVVSNPVQETLPNTEQTVPETQIETSTQETIPPTTEVQDTTI